jgi:hypothetical protein
MKKFIYVAIASIFAFSCSEDKETLINNDTSTAEETLSTERVKGEIPREMHVFTTLQKAGGLSVAKMLELYRQDISKSQGQDYDANLKNMWFIYLNNKVLTEGSKEQKLFIVRQQADMENNLPHFNSFYKLLASVTGIDKAEKSGIAQAFYEKNMKVINEIKWHTPEEKQQKETELILARRNFGIQLQFSK